MNKYQVWIPIYNRRMSEENKRKLVCELRRAEADVALITFGRILCNEDMLREEVAIFSELKQVIEESGIDVGAWLVPTVGYGSEFYGDNRAATDFTHIKKLGGDDVPGAYCPMDVRFADEFSHTAEALAKTGVKLIMLEDDFTLCGGKFMNDLGCACPRHMEMFCNELGESLTREKARELILNGGKSRYRDTWCTLQAEALTSLTKRLEKAIHGVDPDIRIGMSANGSSYTLEGVNITKLAKIIAGKNRPFIRMTGAPYWKQTLTLAPSIEAIRLQSELCKDMDRITEGDTYPRPRHWVPSALLEAYDMILRADGGSEGILKYMIDYNSSPFYERGYVDRHAANKPHYEEIARRFSGKHPVGLRIIEKPMIFAEAELDEDVSIDSWGCRAGKDTYMPLASQWFLADNSIPTTYGDIDFPAFATGENAKYLTEQELRRGVITDIRGAKRLMAMGIDVGIESLCRSERPFAEYFPEYGETTLAATPERTVVYSLTLKEGATVSSEFIVSSSGLGVIQTQGIENCRRMPALYLYENKDGMRFAVYSFVLESVATINEWVPGIYRGYCRQKQLVDTVKWMNGKGLPAACCGNPDLYILTKEGNGELAIGLWNLFADGIPNAKIELSEKYASANFYNTEGTLQGNTISLTKELPPYGFAFITVKK